MKTLYTALIGMLILAFSSTFLQSEVNEEEIKQKLPMLLGSTNAGTEFFLTFHPCYLDIGTGAGIKIYITSAVATTVTVEIPAIEYFKQFTTIPNGIIEIGLQPQEATCYVKSNNMDYCQPHQVYKGRAIIIKSQDPIVTYGMVRYPYTSDGYLGMPTNVLGKDYIVSSYNAWGWSMNDHGLSSYTSIVGVYDKTKVDIVLGGEQHNYTPGTNGLKVGDDASRTLNKGDVWLIGVEPAFADLSGTTVKANKPVAVISGVFCANVPRMIAACDYMIEQDMPIHTWGTKYHVVPIINRKQAPIIRVYGCEPNTIVKRDGEQWTVVKEPGGAQGKGYVEKRTQPRTETMDIGKTPNVTTISSEKRITVSQYNPGIQDDNVDSDPFQLVLTPIEQYQNHIIWCAPGVNNGKSFINNYVNIVYKANADGQIPEDIEFGYVVNGKYQWKKLSSVVPTPGLPFNDPEIPAGEPKWYGVTVTLQDPAGVYSLKANNPFAAYGYGFDWCDSYGYPLSAAFKDLSIPDIWSPTFEFTQNCFGYCQGTTEEQPINNSELRSNFAWVDMDKEVSYNYTFKHDDYEPGTTSTIDWSLTVINTEQAAKAVLYFTDRAGNDTSVTIEYAPTKFNISPKVAAWAQKAYNDPSETKQLTLTNESTMPVVLDSIILISNDPNYNLEYQGFIIDPSIYGEGKLPGKILEPNEKFTFDVIFDPQTVKDQIAEGQSSFLDSVGIKAYWSDDVNDYCYFKYKSAIKSSTGTPCINASNIDFGAITVDNEKIGKIEIRNNGSSDLTINGFEYTGDVVDQIFVANSIGVISNDNPLYIKQGDVVAVEIKFTPKNDIKYSGKIILFSDADDSKSVCDTLDNVIEIIGEGRKPGIDLVGYTWPKKRVRLATYEDANNPYGTSTFPYDCKENGKYVGLEMINNGSESIKLTEISIDKDNSINPEFFWVDITNDGSVDYPVTEPGVFDLLKGIEIQQGPANSRIIPVYYEPKASGTHKLVLIVKGEKNGYPAEASVKFEGTGIYPKASTQAYNLTEKAIDGKVVVGDAQLAPTTIEIKNEKWDPDFSDKLIIYDIKLKDDEPGFISTKSNVAGKNCFAFEYGAINFPIEINAGESFTFPAYYIADKSSTDYGQKPFISHIDFITDADQTVHTSEWSGRSITQGASATGDTATICIHYPQELTAKFTNDADDDVTFIFSGFGLYTGNRDDVFSLKDVNDAQFILKRNESKTITVTCDTDIDLADVNERYIKYSTSMRDVNKKEVKALLKLTTNGYSRTAKSEIVGNPEGMVQKVSYEANPKDAKNHFTYRVYLDKSNDVMVEANTKTDFNLTVKYNPNFLGVEFDNNKMAPIVKLGAGLNAADYAIKSTSEKFDDKTGLNTVTIEIENKGNPVQTNNLIELVTMEFNVFQNRNSVEEAGSPLRTVSIQHEVTTNEACIAIEGGTIPSVQLQDVCAQNTRLIKYNEKYAFKLEDIVPNPISAKGATIKYSIGFDCNVTMKIFDEKGSIISVPISSNMQVGNHSFELPIDTISSGVYFIEMSAGPYKETKRIYIAK